MINAGILDGDLVAVKPATEAPNGSIVVARVEHDETGESEATVKRLFRDAQGFRLQPENPDFTPLRVKNLSLEGIVVGVMRVRPKGV
jgi:repressor LexA